MISDEKLMLQYLEGDYMAFESLYGRHKDRVYSYLNKRIRDKNIINDLFQEIFFKLHRSQKSYDPQKPFINWLYVICKTQMLDYFRKNKISEVELHDFMLEDRNVATAEVDLDQFPALSPKERRAVEMRFNQDKDYVDISMALETSLPASRKIISRALAKIKQTISRRGNHD